ncbi:hypothetical protein CARUB_v10022148mg [Capsella rubella]|uniref:Uncharacterized protein n=1 Tax=Capsella rubella TaxID=81985 RepID=R0I920_9BRAS|nr:paired amphipathic helix protein Sin3-like 4 [Capsella rubella]EOA34590.1 hypothetical protein CARUB_v10022148mg [Capsella rubella]
MLPHKKPTTNEALDYLRAVRDKYIDNHEIYDKFLETMKDYRAERVDTGGVILRVKELFKGEPEILLGFNTFVPMGYKITLNDDETPPNKSIAHFDDAFNFVNKVKKRFENPETFESFLNVLNSYKKENMCVAELYSEVSILFRGHRDLLEEFHQFLPRNG